jgi:hypothetical protein
MRPRRRSWSITPRRLHQLLRQGQREKNAMTTARYDATNNRMVRGDDVATYLANGAITVQDGVAAIAKTSAAAMTLAPPAAGDNGMLLTITAQTAFAHTVTITEGLGGKGASFDVITFAAVGDTITLRAVNAHWVPAGAPYGATIA